MKKSRNAGFEEPEVPEGEVRPEPVGRHWAVKLDCCQQSLCCHCQLCLLDGRTPAITSWYGAYPMKFRGILYNVWISTAMLFSRFDPFFCLDFVDTSDETEKMIPWHSWLQQSVFLGSPESQGCQFIGTWRSNLETWYSSKKGLDQYSILTILRVWGQKSYWRGLVPCSWSNQV